MSLLVFVLVVIVLLALAWVGVDQVSMIPPPFRQLIKLVLIVIAIIAIAQRSGVLG